MLISFSKCVIQKSKKIMKEQGLSEEQARALQKETDDAIRELDKPVSYAEMADAVNYVNETTLLLRQLSQGNLKPVMECIERHLDAARQAIQPERQVGLSHSYKREQKEHLEKLTNLRALLLNA